MIMLTTYHIEKHTWDYDFYSAALFNYLKHLICEMLIFDARLDYSLVILGHVIVV